MRTRSEAFDQMVASMEAKNLSLETLREIEQAVLTLPTISLRRGEMVSMTVRRVVRVRVAAELVEKSDDELRAAAAALTDDDGWYVDKLLGPAQSDALVELAGSRHPEATAAVEEWEQTDDSGGGAAATRRLDRLGVFDYYATSADLD